MEQLPAPVDNLQDRVPMLRNKHEAIIDLLMAAPDMKMAEVAKKVGLSAAYVSTLVNSDTFKMRLSERRGELIDPMITQSFEDRMKGAMQQSLEILTDKLESNQDAELALRVLEMGGRGAAYGARTAGGPAQVGVVINLPGPANNPQAWIEQVNQRNQGK